MARLQKTVRYSKAVSRCLSSERHASWCISDLTNSFFSRSTAEESRSRYLASLFEVIFSIFHGTIINHPEETIPGQVTAIGKIEHVLYAFSTSVIVFVEVNTNLTIRRQDAVGQVIAECDGLDFQNSTLGYWCPILGVLSDRTSLQLFVYAVIISIA